MMLSKVWRTAKLGVKLKGHEGTGGIYMSIMFLVCFTKFILISMISVLLSC